MATSPRLWQAFPMTQAAPAPRPTARAPPTGSTPPTQPHCDLRLAAVERPAQCRPQVVLLAPQALQPGGPQRTGDRGLGRLGQRQEEVGVLSLERPQLAGRGRLLQPVLANRLQHPE